ncbi:hypothetical protein [Actinocorallia populi]|uniref:hypothetical protein n=1 Tax=Actinocorallia populi TaxID=2079200 RepID=UPI0013003F04|nr:hypothetical protein [Actinocorallia populi]
MPTTDDVQQPEHSLHDAVEAEEAPAPPEAAAHRPAGRPKKRLPIPPLMGAPGEPSV